MNLWTKKVIAGILLVNMLVGIAPTLNVYGFEHQPEETKLEQSVDVVSIDEEYSKNKEEKLIEKQGRVANESEKEGAFNDSDKEIAQVGENSESEIRYGEINFVYIENPYVQTPNIQRIVFSFDQEITGAEKVALIVENEKGNQEEWQLTKQSGSLYLFEKEYEQGTLGGVYKVVKLVLKNHIEEKIVVLDDINVKAEFGVDASYEGIEELKPLEGQLSENQSGVEASIVTIDEEGTTQAQNNIAEALKVVSTERANAIGTREQPLESKSENIVVALDPGHDANDAGAQGHGLKEEDLTLKIANYCKQELEQYAGVTVYMTRTGAACPYNKPGITCMEDRVNAAVNAGAKIFVSFHLNSSVSSAVKGAEVIVPNNSWKAEVGAAGRELGEAILDELVALGLTRRSVYSKDTTINERYPDGSISDYFSVQIHCKEHGIPGLIVEHAFLSNSSDVNNFLKTESGLKKLGIADATGIAKYLGLVKGYWEKVGDGYKFNIGSGKYLKQQWLFVNGKWYYLDADGYRVTGWKDIGIYRYFFNPQGEMHTGWYSEKSVWYYFGPSGNMYTGWKQIGIFKYYFNQQGEMYTGRQVINGEEYYFGPSGNMYTGWLKENNKWYYYDSLNGKMVKGWAKIGQFWYYFDKAGKMLTGWQNIGIFKYYFGPSGNMYIGWQEIAGKKYYFGPSGNMYTGDQIIDGDSYHFDENGILIQKNHVGWKQEGSTWYYYDKTGSLTKGWAKIGQFWYYFDKAGKMLTGWQNIGIFKYYFGPSGNMYIGWQEIAGKKYYFGPSGNMYTGDQIIDGDSYHFDENGVLIPQTYVGWKQEGSTWYYYDKTGSLTKGWAEIGQFWYYFDKAGKMLTGWQNIGIFKYYFGPSGNMYIGWQEIAGKKYYFGPSGNMYTGWKEFDGHVYYFDENGVLNEEKKPHAITGASAVTINEMETLFEKSGKKYPGKELGKGGAPDIRTFCRIYFEEAEMEGIKAEVAFAQAMLETGYLQYGKDVKIEQFNFAGLGATGNGATGESFPDVRTGIRAHIQHLQAYSSKTPLKNQLVDNRYKYVKRGCAPYVEWLGIQENPEGKGWATAKRYGESIMNILKKM